MTTTTLTNQQERRGELEPCDLTLTSPRPWKLRSGGEIVDANGAVILKIWNGWNNAALAVNAVNSYAALTDEVARLREAARAALSLLENIGTGKWAKTPAGDKLRAALQPGESEGEGRG